MSTPAASRDGGRILVGGERLSELVERVRSGGDKFHPQTLQEARDLLAPQASALRGGAQMLDSRLRARRVVFEVQLLPNYLANSYFPTRLVDLLDLTSLGSRPAIGTLTTRTRSEQAPSKALIVAGEDSSLANLEELLRTGGRTKSERAAAEELRQFASLRLPRSEEIIRANPGADFEQLTSGPGTMRGERFAFEAVLHPDPDSAGRKRQALSVETFQKFLTLVESLDGQVLTDHRDVIGGLTFVPVLLPAGQIEAAAEFNPLRSIRVMPRLRPVPALPLRTTQQQMGPPPLPAAPDAPEVLIFDAGADDTSTYFRGSVVTTHLTSEPPVPGCLEHGSAVTSAVLYGDVDPSRPLTTAAAQVHHLRVVPGPDTDITELYWTLDQIRDTVVAKGVRLVNLSLGPEVAVEEGELHRWTAVLDELAYEHGVLFVVAAGNNGESDAALGLNRIQVPGDMVNGLTVGACDGLPPDPNWSRAFYSAIGPGRPGARLQPTGVAFGGDEKKPFTRLHGDGRLSFTWGTSYAAPLAVHGLVELTRELGELCTASTLRALAVHFAEAHPSDEAHLEVGHGRFISEYSEALRCPEDQVTVLYQASIARNEVLGFTLPVPKELTLGNVKLRWTLAFASPTDPTEAVEYTKVGLEVVLRPHAATYMYRDPGNFRKTEKVNIIDNPQRVAQLLKQGWVQGRNPVTRSRPKQAGEAARRDNGKWQTVWRSEDSMRASSLRVTVQVVLSSGSQGWPSASWRRASMAPMCCLLVVDR